MSGSQHVCRTYGFVDTMQHLLNKYTVPIGYGDSRASGLPAAVLVAPSDAVCCWQHTML